MLKHLKVAREITEQPTVIIGTGKAVIVAPYSCMETGRSPLAYIGVTRGYYPTRLGCGYTLDLANLELPLSGELMVRGSRIYGDDWSADLEELTLGANTVRLAKHKITRPIAFELTPKTIGEITYKTFSSALLGLRVAPGGLSVSRHFDRETSAQIEFSRKPVKVRSVFPAGASFKPLEFKIDPQLLKYAIEHTPSRPEKIVFDQKDREAPFALVGADFQVLIAPMRF